MTEASIIGLVEYMAKSLVEHPDQVSISSENKEGTVEITLKVAESDMGKVIGKQGRIAKSMRSVLKAAATKEGKKYILEISE